SRSGGQKRSEHFRMTASYYSKRIADSIQQSDPNAQIVLMGDLNDDPSDRSVKRFIHSKYSDMAFYNPMEAMHKKGVGSIAHRDRWHLFDQLIFTKNFLNDGPLWLEGAGVYRKKFLTQLEGRFKNYPLRTYVGINYVGGYSDHFPVIALLTAIDPKGYE
ncbi:MAG: endonuclease/exonuclease/phosphatase family protein, partial [Flavobacteriaceae bacterium]